MQHVPAMIINSSLPSAPYIRQWIESALVQIMAYSVPSHYLNQCWIIETNWTLRNKLQWNLDQNTKLFNHKNVFENNVCEMTAIFSSRRWVNFLQYIQQAITWANTDPVLCCHMASLGHNELTREPCENMIRKSSVNLPNYPCEPELPWLVPLL